MQQFFVTELLQSKKGFIITAIALGAITAGSFAVWMIPQNSHTQLVVSNPKDNLDALVDQQKTISDSDKEEFDKMMSGQITYDNYISIAQVSSSQINSMIINMMSSDVSGQWHDSYSAFLDSLRGYNSYLKETIVIAEKLKSDPAADVSAEKANMEKYLSEAQDSKAKSDSSRPA